MDRESFRYDILSELFNIGVGKAADMLSEIVRKKIVLRVPRIELPDPEEGPGKLKERFPELFNAALMVSTISFSEKLTGRANLVFPADKMREFVALCSGGSVVQPGESDFTDIDFDVIREIGNIVLNCILGELGNLLNIPLTYDLPRVVVYDRIDFRRDIETGGYRSAVILYVTFLIDSTEIEGAVIVDLTVSSIRELFRLLDGIEAEL